MKKKLLSLVLAGAMVASTSVSAFAATDEATYIIDDKGKEHQVDITGNVQNQQGNIVPGTISVTVPTAVSFTIDKTGQITGGDIVVRNSSDDKVEVVAKEFTDTTPTNKIVLVKDDELETEMSKNGEDKVHMTLNLTGNGKAVGLFSNKSTGKSGFVDLTTKEEIGDNVNTPLGNAWKNNDLTLRLSGKTKAGSESYSAPENALQDTFNLVLKIQKVKS